MVAQIGELNRNMQRLVRKTRTPGTDHNQYVWVQVCERDASDHAGVCGHQYGANGSDFHERKCPACQGGATGLPLPSAAQRVPHA